MILILILYIATGLMMDHNIYQLHLHWLSTRHQGCFTNSSWAPPDILSKCVYCRNRISYENVNLKLTCAQSYALVSRTKFQLEILTINMIYDIVYFREIILENSRNVSETISWLIPCARQ